jgi:hypothetical protein
MSAKPARTDKAVRFCGVDALPSAPPLSKAVKAMSDAQVQRRAAADPEAGVYRRNTGKLK